MKARLKSAEKQDQNIKYIVETMKSSENARKKELKDTKDILDYSRDKIRDLENITIHQISKVHHAEKKVEKLKLKLREKDSVIKDLKSRMKDGAEAEKIKYLEGEVELCQKEKFSEQKTREKLEKNLENLNTASLVGIYLFIYCCIFSLFSFLIFHIITPHDQVLTGYYICIMLGYTTKRGKVQRRCVSNAERTE